jgi:hypothetical protein
VRRFAGAPFLLSTTDSKAKRFDRWSNTWIPIERHPNPAPMNQAAPIASLGTHEANDATFHNRHAQPDRPLGRAIPVAGTAHASDRLAARYSRLKEAVQRAASDSIRTRL